MEMSNSITKRPKLTRKAATGIVSLALITVLFLLPSHTAAAAIWSGTGMPTAVGIYYRPDYSGAWNVRLAVVDSSWNSVPEVSYSRTTAYASTPNQMFVANFAWQQYGIYTRYTTPGGARYFSIQLNSRRIAEDYNPTCGLADCWGNFVKSVGSHELGHALNLGHDPQAPGKPPGYYLSIMASGNNRDRNLLYTPQSFDRQNVSAHY